MAKTTAPLLSFSASGQIAKTQVYSKWKGRSYVRRYVTPANPRSVDQTLTRDTFSWLQAVFKLAPPLAIDPWNLFAKGKVLTPRNAFTSKNLSLLRTASDLTDFVFSPGALGGPPPATVVPTGGAGEVTIVVTAPATVPTGWTLTSAIGAAIGQQDPQSGVEYAIHAGEDLTTPYSIVLAGLAPGVYWCGGWLKWTRPDGLFAYSPSLQAAATAT
jgi:hypothetical protein